MVKRLLYVSLALFGCLAVASIYWVARANSGYQKGKALSELKLWGQARLQLGRYIWLHPNNHQARLLMAEAIIKDESLDDKNAVPLALEHLAVIDNQSPLAAEARTHEGRLHFLLHHQVARAERKLRQAIKFDPQLRAPHELLWKVFDMTDRVDLAGPAFWKVYELTPDDQKIFPLIEWYISQFFTSEANPTLNQQMGFPPIEKVSGQELKLHRLLDFRKNELDEVVGHAILARYFHTVGNPKFAIKILDEVQAAQEASKQHPYFVATRIGVLLDLNRFNEADALLENWPPDHQGYEYEYWRWRGVVYQKVRRDYAEALKCYRRALNVSDKWPGALDWRTHNRMAACLRRLGRPQEAAKELEASKRIEQLMEPEIHKRLRVLIRRINDPQSIYEVAKFYEKTGLPKETAAWFREVERIKARASASGQ